jgi:hypothetical protein
LINPKSASLVREEENMKRARKRIKKKKMKSEKKAESR